MGQLESKINFEEISKEYKENLNWRMRNNPFGKKYEKTMFPGFEVFMIPIWGDIKAFNYVRNADSKEEQKERKEFFRSAILSKYALLAFAGWAYLNSK